MKVLPVLVASLSVAFSLALVSFAAKANSRTAPANESRNPVVIELFTSEGCSSCPSADALLQRLLKQQPVGGADIIAFEEHVDYWNHDGWVDPFSSSDWTQRQVDYAGHFRNDPYTPELVVDGHTQFVGNNSRQAEAEIEKAARSPKAQVAINVSSSDAAAAPRFNISVAKLDENLAGDIAEVWLAVTEDGLHSSVSRGENSGRVLQHAATLRSLKKIGVVDSKANATSFSADPTVKFDSHWNAANLRVTVFVQKRKTREIIGAASTRVKG